MGENAGMAGVRIPTCLSETSRHADVRLAEWVAALPALVPELAEWWELQVGEPYEPGGQCSWVAPARTARGDDLVLKVGWRHPEAAHEADGLRWWAGDGAVELHAADDLEHTSVLLLERCSPGTPLGGSMPEPEQDLVVAALLRRLWRPLLPAAGPFRPLQTMCEAWAAEFEEGLASSSADIDRGLAREGITMFRELPQTADCCMLLCTDLHGENILAAEREPWLVIDPKPYVGDPAYDVLQHMLNCPRRLESDPVHLCRRLAGLLDLDAERLIQWLFARCIQESLGCPLLYGVAARIAP